MEHPGQLQARMESFCCPPPAACDCLPVWEHAGVAHRGCVADKWGNGFCKVDPATCAAHLSLWSKDPNDPFPHVYCNPGTPYTDTNGTCQHAQCEGAYVLHTRVVCWFSVVNTRRFPRGRRW